MKLSLIIPCYNEEKNIKLFFESCINIFGKDNDIEYVFINDGSRDNTYLEIKKIIKKYNILNIICLNFSRNFGKEAAMYAGLKNCSGEYAAIIDADLQQNPKYVKEMLNFIEKNQEYDCVTCYQNKRKEGFVLTSLKNCFYSIVNKITDVHFHKNASDFRLMNRKMIEAIISMEEYYRFSKGIFSFVGFNNYYMPYEVEERKNGKSSWSIIKLMRYAKDGILSFTTMPLKISSLFGFLTFLLSVIFIILKIIRYIVFADDINSSSIIIFLILFFSGLQMILIGLLGEYIGRNYVQSMKRPIYIIKDKVQTKR